MEEFGALGRGASTSISSDYEKDMAGASRQASAGPGLEVVSVSAATADAVFAVAAFALSEASNIMRAAELD